MLTVLGIDPGITGGIAILGETPMVFDMPTLAIAGDGGTIRRRVDVKGLYELLLPHLADASVYAVIEGIAAGGRKSSKQSVGSQYRTRGQIETVLELMGLTVHEVYPGTWKRLFGVQGKAEAKKAGDSAERDACMLAKRLYPSLEDDLCLVKHHNRAEAVLIAHYARKTLA